MEKYQYATKYMIGDAVFVIRHNLITERGINGKDVESCEIYLTKIKEINIDSFGISYRVEDVNNYFREKDVFLQTEKEELYNRFLQLIEKKEEK